MIVTVTCTPTVTGEVGRHSSNGEHKAKQFFFFFFTVNVVALKQGKALTHLDDKYTVSKTLLYLIAKGNRIKCVWRCSKGPP